MTTTNKDDIYKLPAEWEADTAILLAWPHVDTDWAYMLPEAMKCYIELVAALTVHHKVVIATPDVAVPKRLLRGLPQEKVKYFEVPTNDTWARDFGLLSVVDPDGNWKCLDFRFNGWGLKFASCFDNMVNKAMAESGLILADMECRQNFVLEGGGIESDGKGSLMTTAYCQLSYNRNPNRSADEIKRYLMEAFGASNIVWIEHGYLAGDDTDSHIDTLARFAPNNTIVYVGCNDESDEHFAELSAMKRELQSARNAAGEPFNLMELPMPAPIYDEEGLRLPATYANFLATDKAIFMPTYGQPQTDLLAQRILEVAYGREVLAIDCRALIRQHGSLHCVTMQIPAQILNLR